MNFRGRIAVPIIIATGLLRADANHEFADSLFNYGFYREAATEYRRYSVNAGRTADTALLKLGLSLAASGSLPEAAEVLRRVSDLSPHLAQPSLLALAGFYVRAGQLASARVEISDILLFASDSAERHVLYADRAWIALQEHDFGLAQADLLKTNRALSLATNAPSAHRSSTLAVALSSLLPGAGEIYAGQLGHGLLAFLATAGTGFATYQSARENDWVTATVLFSALFLRFYNGSRRNALDFVEDYNDRRDREFVSRVVVEQRLQPDWFRGVRPLTGPNFPQERESAPVCQPALP